MFGGFNPTTSKMPPLGLKSPASITTTAASSSISTAFPSLTQTLASSTALPNQTNTINLKPTTQAQQFPLTGLTPSTSTSNFAVKPPQESLTFSQFEEKLSQWARETQEQEKDFTDKAAKINALDHVVQKNINKIYKLLENLQSVKKIQSDIQNTLETVRMQQTDMENFLDGMEKLYPPSNTTQHTPRTNMFSSCNKIDALLKSMNRDLTESIDHINDTTKPDYATNPLIQVGNILNSHMNLLNWINENSTNLQNQLVDVKKMIDEP